MSAPQSAEALPVLERVAAEHGATLTLVGREWRYRPVLHSLDGQTFEIWSADEDRQINALRAAGHPVDWRPTRLELPLLGAHQVENAATAYAALMALRAGGLPIAHEAIEVGLRTVRWPGRFEILHRQPFVVVDGAHNRDSARRLALALDDYFPAGRPASPDAASDGTGRGERMGEAEASSRRRRVILIFGASSDKDIAGMLDELLPRVGHVIISQAVHPRALEPDDLAAQAAARAGSLPIEVRAPVAAALARAVELAVPEDVILACGSLFIVAEVHAALGELMTDR